MPKKAKKRLTQRKGQSTIGRSTRRSQVSQLTGNTAAIGPTQESTPAPSQASLASSAASFVEPAPKRRRISEPDGAIAGPSWMSQGRMITPPSSRRGRRVSNGPGAIPEVVGEPQERPTSTIGNTETTEVERSGKTVVDIPATSAEPETTGADREIESAPAPDVVGEQRPQDLEVVATQANDEHNPVVIPPEGEIVADEALENGMVLQYEREILFDEHFRNVRAFDEEEIQRLRDEIERQRERYNQIPTYLQAANRNADPCRLGAMNGRCNFCNAMFFRCEANARSRYNKCCFGGKVGNLPPLEEVPLFLQNLFKNTPAFRRAVLQYNYAFQFASTEASRRELGPGLQVYAIQGQMLHHYSDVNVNNLAPKFGPIYFLDPHAAVFQRMANNNRDILNVNVVREIEQYLRDNNPFAQGYCHLKEVYERAIAADPAQVPVFCLEFRAVRGDRQLDLPQLNEVATVYRYNEELGESPDIRIFTRGQPSRFSTVRYHDEKLDPLTFPLLFPRGERGWHPFLYHVVGNRKITANEYYAFRLALRPEEPGQYDRFRYAGKLLQQYVVAAYVKIESQRINYLRLNQGRLRAELYVGLVDYLFRYGQRHDAEHIGRMVILPSSFAGSPRAQMQNFQDALAVCAKFGNPSLFITMTANPKWPEITENIPANADTADHPLVIARVFQAKLEDLKKRILDDHIFGVPVSLIYVIEFQKRGLPHAHMLLFLRQQDKTTDALRVEQLISAELPDPQEEQELYQVVRRNMMHGPCGRPYPNAPCMQDGRCSKGFPKAFSEHTLLLNSGQVVYKRPDNGRLARVQIRGENQVQFLDNRYVVPYNPYLLLRYNCHICVEACASLKVVKYLFKYFFKGVDKALISIGRDNSVEYDETASYITGRYLSPPESAWRILQFSTHVSTHTVIRLQVHREQEQVVFFQNGFERAAVDRNESTQLTDWFRLNREDPEARRYLYSEIPIHYVWKAADKRWARRQRFSEKIVTRLYSVSVRNTETYYLRLLLLHVRGAQSFLDLRTVDGREYETYLAACEARGLLQDDREWVSCLREAVRNDMPERIRRMFAYILCFAVVNNPPELWTQFREDMVEDFTRNGVPMDRAVQRGLSSIQAVLLANNKRLSDFNLPEPEVPVVLADDVVDPVAERAIADDLQASLTPEQRAVFDTVLNAAENDGVEPRLFYLKGSAGCGKSYVYNTIVSSLRARDIGCLSVAFTGLAASLLRGGRTVHSAFKLPVPLTDTSVSGLKPNSAAGRLVKEAKVIIWDEISMVPRLCFKAVDLALKDLMANDLPFGGKVVVVGGDFKQTLPVLISAYRSQIVDECVKSSALWPLFHTLELHQNMRAGPLEREFNLFLGRLGDGSLAPTHAVPGHRDVITVPRQCVVDDTERLIEACFDRLGDDAVPKEAILTPLNVDCNTLNERILAKLPGEPVTYASADTAEFDTDEERELANYPPEYLNSLEPSGFPPHRLTLKVGAVVMLLRNLNLKENLCNGTRLVITYLGARCIRGRRIGPDGALTDQEVLIPRIDFIPLTDTLAFTLRRRQYPVKLAYAVTINKSQGQTYEKVGIYLPQPVFAHGQLYVAFSRAKGMDKVYVHVEDTASQGRLLRDVDEVFTKNIVYREVV